MIIYIFDNGCDLPYENWRGESLIIKNYSEPLLHRYADKIIVLNHNDVFCYKKKKKWEPIDRENWYKNVLTEQETQQLMLDILGA